MAMPRRLRGVLGMAVTWGVGFVALGTTVFAAAMLFGGMPASLLTPRIVVSLVVRAFVSGAFVGTLFAGLVDRGVDRRGDGRAGAPARPDGMDAGLTERLPRAM